MWIKKKFEDCVNDLFLNAFTTQGFLEKQNLSKNKPLLQLDNTLSHLPEAQLYSEVKFCHIHATER